LNTKIKILRFVFALAIALSALGISASAAFAAKPVMYEVTFSSSDVLTDVCSFPVGIDGNVTLAGTDFVDDSGVVTRSSWHMVEQDTFTANGKMLVGIPFRFNVEVHFDSSGNPTHWYIGGVFEKIPLPDGSLFISAGRIDFTDHPGATYILSPDKGNPGNIAGFCAALAP
jgi:hypothetical protein